MSYLFYFCVYCKQPFRAVIAKIYVLILYISVFTWQPVNHFGSVNM